MCFLNMFCCKCWFLHPWLHWKLDQRTALCWQREQILELWLTFDFEIVFIKQEKGEGYLFKRVKKQHRIEYRCSVINYEGLRQQSHHSWIMRPQCCLLKGSNIIAWVPNVAFVLLVPISYCLMPAGAEDHWRHSFVGSRWNIPGTDDGSLLRSARGLQHHNDPEELFTNHASHGIL